MLRCRSMTKLWGHLAFMVYWITSEWSYKYRSHFYASATKHLGIGMSVGLLVGFDTNFKKVPEMIYAPWNKFFMIWVWQLTSWQMASSDCLAWLSSATTEISKSLDGVLVLTSFAQSRLVSVSTSKKFLSLDECRSQHLINFPVSMSLGLDIHKISKSHWYIRQRKAKQKESNQTR